MIRLLIALLIGALSCFAADDSPQSQLLAIDSAFVGGHYSQVELLTLRLVQSGAPLTPEELSRVDLTAGYSLIMMNREPEAREYFRRALEVDPNLTLDPVQVSPKFRVVFDEVKANFQTGKSTESQIARPPGSHPPSSSAMLSNLIVPGSGQWHDGRHLRGAAFFLAQAASVGLLVWQINQLHDSHEDYLAETDPRRIADAYDAYNRDYTAAWGAGALVAAVYVAAQADLILFRPTVMNVQANRSVSPGILLTVRW